jgi:hypothetical protein
MRLTVENTDGTKIVIDDLEIIDAPLVIELRAFDRKDSQAFVLNENGERRNIEIPPPRPDPDDRPSRPPQDHRPPRRGVRDFTAPPRNLDVPSPHGEVGGFECSCSDQSLLRRIKGVFNFKQLP